MGMGRWKNTGSHFLSDKFNRKSFRCPVIDYLGGQRKTCAKSDKMVLVVWLTTFEIFWHIVDCKRYDAVGLEQAVHEKSEQLCGIKALPCFPRSVWAGSSDTYHAMSPIAMATSYTRVLLASRLPNGRKVIQVVSDAPPPVGSQDRQKLLFW